MMKTFSTAFATLVIVLACAVPVRAQVVPGSVFRLTTGPCDLKSGTGSPEGVRTATVCSLWLQTDSPYTLWRKTSGSGNTGWVPITSGTTGTPTPGGAGTFVRSDGTNWTTSTLILPNAGTQYQIPYYTAANTLGASASLLFDGSNLGVGVTPTNPLHVANDSAGTFTAFITNANAAGVGLAVRTGGSGTHRAFTVQTGTTDNFVVLGNGNVGIGAAPVSPYRLDITFATQYGYGLRINTTTYGGATKRANMLLGGWEIGQDLSANGTQNFYLYDTVNAPTGTRFFIDTAGKVGVGTTAPSDILHVKSDTDGNAHVVVENPNAGVSARAGVIMSNTAAETTVQGFIGVGGTGYTGVPSWQDTLVVNAGSSLSGGLKLRSVVGGIGLYAEGSTSVPDIFINESGLVGIGTTAPSQQLNVYGTSAAVSIDDDDNPFILLNKRNATARNFYIQVAGDVLSIGNNGAQSFNVDNTGKVGIGTAAPDDTLTVKSTSHALLGLDAAAGAESDLRFEEAGARKWLIRRDSSHNLRFYSETAGAYALTLEATTNYVGIGTTDPAALLHTSSGAGQVYFQSNGGYAIFGPSGRIGAGGMLLEFQPSASHTEIGNSSATPLIFYHTAGTKTLTLGVGSNTWGPSTTAVSPDTNYFTSLGGLSKKYLSLHAAELWVETLVAQDVMATVGGRIVVAPTTMLVNDLADSADAIPAYPNATFSGVTHSGGAACATDGITSQTCWHTDSAVAGATITWDFDAEADPKIALVGVWAYGGTSAAVWKAQYSDDGAAWSDLCTMPSLSQGDNWQYCYAANTTTHRYWRIYLTNAPGGGTWQGEVRLFQATPVYVEHNALASGDIVRMESNGKIEFMAVVSGATAYGGDDYYYYVVRDLDRTGTNAWYAGDALLNTGTTGDGFIDLYSTSGVLSGTGPTIVGNVRTAATASTGGYAQVAPRWAIGNMNGLFNIAADTYGAAFGNPSGDYLIALPTSISFYNSTTLYGYLSSGNWVLGRVAAGQSNVYITSGVIEIRNNTSARIRLAADGSGFLANSSISWDTSGNLTVAANATIGGWAISSDRLTSGAGASTVGVSSDGGWAFYAGSATPSSAPFRVSAAGSIVGSIGSIGGWDLTSTTLTGGNAVLTNTGNAAFGTSNDIVRISADDATYRLWIGHATAASAPFRVTKAGVVTAVGGTFTGPVVTLGEPETASSNLAFARPSGNGLGQSGDYFGLRSFGAAVTSQYLYLQNIPKGDASTPAIDARTYMSAQGWTDAGSGSSTTLTEIVVRSAAGTSSITLTADTYSVPGTFGAVTTSDRITVNTGTDGPLILNYTGGSDPNTQIAFYRSGVVKGSITTSGTVTAYNTTSDERLKTNWRAPSYSLATLMQVQVRDFDWIATRQPGTGVSAQQLGEVYPWAVASGATWQVDYGKLTPLLVVSVQELKAELDALRAEVRALKGRR